MGPLFLTPFIDKFGDYLLNGLWPSWELTLYCAMVGAVNTMIGGRAFFDGSAERDKQPKASDLKPPTEPTKPHDAAIPS